MVWFALALMGVTHVFAAKLTLTFQDNANNEAVFEIERAKASEPFVLVQTLPAKVETAPSTVTYVDEGLEPSTSYSYRVRAVNTVGPSAYSAVATATTLADGPPPSKPNAPSNPKLAR